jgi:uncharacterized protein
MASERLILPYVSSSPNDTFAGAAMRTNIPHRIIWTALFVAVSTTSLRAQVPTGREPASPVEPFIEVVGHGEIRVPPDRATVILSVETKGPVAAAVAAANARVQRRVLDTLKALGYSGTLVSTVGYNVEPDYEPMANAPQPKQVGYVSRNSVQVTLTQLDRVGPVIDAALARGANSVQDIAFDASNTDAPRQRALAQATASARGDATAIATSMGGTLGRLVSVATQGQFRPMQLSQVKVAYRSDAVTPINPGEITVEASVTGRWQFVAP